MSIDHCEIREEPMAKKSGLGKGLDALFLDNETTEGGSLKINSYPAQQGDRAFRAQP